MKELKNYVSKQFIHELSDDINYFIGVNNDLMISLQEQNKNYKHPIDNIVVNVYEDVEVGYIHISNPVSEEYIQKYLDNYELIKSNLVEALLSYIAKNRIVLSGGSLHENLEHIRKLVKNEIDIWGAEKRFCGHRYGSEYHNPVSHRTFFETSEECGCKFLVERILQNYIPHYDNVFELNIRIPLFKVAHENFYNEFESIIAIMRELKHDGKGNISTLKELHELLRALSFDFGPKRIVLPTPDIVALCKVKKHMIDFENRIDNIEKAKIDEIFSSCEAEIRQFVSRRDQIIKNVDLLLEMSVAFKNNYGSSVPIPPEKEKSLPPVKRQKKWWHKLAELDFS